MTENTTKKEIIKYFLSNIFESKSAYEAWKMISYSKSSGVVGENMAKKYVEIQKIHAEFFILSERAFLIMFVMLVCHAFDRDSRTCSLHNLDEKEYDIFYEKNKNVIEKLKKIRDKIFAHKDKNIFLKDILVPSVDDLDAFFKELELLYNKLSSKIDNSTAWFDNTKNLKDDIECLFMNLERGETVRLKELDIHWLWEEDPNKISNKI